MLKLTSEASLCLSQNVYAHKVLATICEDLPSDGVLLIYLSASGSGCAAENESGCLRFGPRGDGGLNCIYPSDILPFTRRPLLLVIDSESSEAFKVIAGKEKGESVAMLLSPSCLPPIASADCSRYLNGSLFTMFLTAPLQAFCLLLGLSGTNMDLDKYNKAEKLLLSSLSDWGLALATSDTLNPVWGQIIGDPFIRRLLLRFIFFGAVLTLYAPVYNKEEFLPLCIPSLPTPVLPSSSSSKSVILQLASIFGATQSFIFSEEIDLPEKQMPTQ